MATNLLTNEQKSYFTGLMGDHFYSFTLSNTRVVVIHKEPLKTLISNPVSPIYGYNESSSLNSYTYTPISGVYPAMISPKLPPANTQLEEIKSSIEKGTVRIKVEQLAHDFIEDGRKNEKIEFDGQTFNFISSDGIQSFLGLKYYIYNLERTN